MTIARTILVTGAHGFVGKAVCAELRRRGANVRAAARVAEAGGDSISVGDIGASTDWSAALSGVDCVIHCAARVHKMDDNAANPLQAFRAVNVDGTMNLARQAATAGVRRFIFVSSIKVNGESTEPGRPFQADQEAAPCCAYGFSKLEAETGLREVAARTGLEYVVVRPPLVYGRGVKANFAAMMHWVARGVPLPLGAVTANRRSMIGLDNLVDLLAGCIDHPAAANQVFLAGDGHSMSTAELLRRLGAAVGKPTRLLPVSPRLLHLASVLAGKRDVAQRLLGNLEVDITKTCELLNWTPPVSIDEGLRNAAQKR